MANYPFKNKNYLDVAGKTYNKFDFNATYYTIIDGKLMAIKPLVLYFDNPNETSSSVYCYLYVLAANGKKYKLDECVKIYRNYDEYLNDVYQPALYDYNKFGKKAVNDSLKLIPGIQFSTSKDRFYQYYWRAGRPSSQTGEALFWVDVDGAHVELKEKNCNNQKLYISQEECFKDNVQVVEFGDMEVERKGEYTIKREFTVKATSQEEAENIIDEAINKAYKEQFK